MKSFAVFFGIIASFVVGLECLELAANKDFWMDEIFEVHSVWNEPTSSLIRSGGLNSPGKSLLYFGAQKLVMKRILANEAATGKGWDWRVSMRIVPTAFYVLGCILCVLIWARLQPLIACLLPILLSNYHSAIWYGAETRSHGPWAIFSLLYYSISIGMILNPKERRWKVAWVMGCLVMMLLGITSILMIATVASAVMCATVLSQYFSNYGYLKRKTEDLRGVRIVPTLIVGAGLSLILFFYWNEQQGRISLSNVKEPLSYYLNHFTTYALEPLGGLKTTILLAFGTIVLFTAGILRRDKLSMSIAVLAVSQAILLVGVYSAQILYGYFFAPRHGLFIVGIRALIVSGLSVLGLQILMAGVRYLKFVPKQKIAVFSMAFVLLAFGIDWWNWSLKEIPGTLLNLKHRYGSYCHVGIPFEDRFDHEHRAEEYHFNLINKVRHSSTPCEELKNNLDISMRTYNFSPDWIYESTNSR